MTVTLSQYVEQNVAKGATLFALLMSLNAVVVVLLQAPISRWADGRTPIVAIVTGNLMFALGDIGYALSHSWTAFMVSMFLFTLGEMLNYPAANVLIDRLAPDGMRGTYFGAQSFSNIGHFIGPLLGGYLLSNWGGSRLFLLLAVVTVFGSYFYWRGCRLNKIVRKSL
ncbi:hypothetical protein PAESOLCIP111_02740 [Paenibacillus solanacearum]|uniref:Major facilitator superfamily (MFS) profile domain-containing protein n=1 Tax=Paenibacillus solanacearum TaxID=2048548 RepID=A0A916K1A5_9BACL|nr:MFS transporter [Paenibacillus solanacearum]CAG7625571.1 hypothetical protein PAESOLCIP111_02740 [Paenibacillus solanacearum]